MDAAKAEAKRTGKEVEIPSLHTENMTTVATPGGKTVKTYVSSTVVRVKRDDGWHKVDPTLIVENGVVKSRMTKLDIRLSNGGSATPLLTAKGEFLGVEKSQPGEVGIAGPGNLPVPELSGNTATYRSAYGRNIDLVVAITPAGYQHQIVIRERPRERLKLPVPIDPPSGMRLGKSSSGRPAALADGKEIADLSALPILDAKEIASPGTGKASTVATTLTGSGDDTALVLTPDATFLADPAVTYPVTVAASNSTPWHGAGAPADTFIANGGSYVNGSYAANMQALFAGRRDGYNYRSYLKFDLTNAPFFGQRIVDANIILWNYLSSACGEVGGISLHRVANEWTPTTIKWNDQPLAVADGHVVNPYGKDESCSDWMAEGDLWYSIEDITRAWANGTPNHGIMVRAVAESGANNWRQYLSGNWPNGTETEHHPFFYVEYEAPLPPLGAVGWYFGGEAGITDRSVMEAIDANPDLARAAGSLPLAQDITFEEAIADRNASSEHSEVLPGEIVADNPETDDPPPADTSPPTVARTDPQADSTVSAVSEIYVRFNEDVTGVQVTVKDSSGSPVGGVVESSHTAAGWKFKPQTTLSPGAYHVTVEGAADAAGNAITAPYAWTFSVGRTTAEGLVAAFGFEEGSGTTTVDSSGNGHTGTASATTWVSGKFGNALSFTGSNGSWLTVPHSESLRLTAGMTLSAWVKPATNDSYRTVLMKDHSKGSAYGIYSSNGTVPSAWFLKPDATSHNQVDGTSALPANSWSHVATTYDGTTARLYVNGDQVAQLTTTGDLVDDGGALRIGGNTRWGEYFNGTIDEVRIYNRAQSTDEIQTDMATAITEPGPPPADGQGLVAAFGFEEGSGTTTVDSSGNGHTGTASATTWVSGKFGNALSFTGSNGSWLTVPHSESLRLTAGMTLSAWVKPATNDSYRTVLMKDHSNGSAYGIYSSNGTVPSAWFLKPDATSHNQVDGTSALPANSWSHVATTYDGTTARLYVNGDQVAQLTTTGDLVDDGGALRIGGNTRWGEYFNGTIDEVRIYNRAQSTDEIQTDMATAVSFAPPLRGTAAKSAAAAIPPDPDNNLPKAANAFDRLTPTKCAQNESLSGRPQGWVLNHYTWCQLGRVNAIWQSGRCIDPNSTICIPEQETFRAKVMLIGHSFNGTVGVDRAKGDTPRDFVVEAYVYDAATYGAMPPTRRMTLNVDIGNKKNCEVVRSRGGQSIDNSRSDIISNWKVNGRATFWFRCSPGKAPVFRTNEWVTPTKVRNDEDVSITTIRPSVNLPDWPNTRWMYITPTVRTVIGNSIRCDSATYIAFRSGGCIFYKTKPAIKWTHTAPTRNRTLQMKQAFQHYWNACTDPDGQTYPDKPDKNIFGCDVGNGATHLHRETQEQRDINQTNTNTRCNRMWPGYTNGTDPDPNKWKQCDEIPFASTMERTIAPLQRDFSLCPIRAQHNGDAGLYLARFYDLDRVLIADAFTNRFDTSQNDPISRDELCGVPTNPH
ncbi:LamG-like jellyroll fold domain-containing protein [Nonomuraea sp. NPDC050394]|uniref:LamG-like jellyroll fold domain-containing protein n=1 Tax=Nonomuraea sp. NPDC050394 TaxID=3364363 RepID=UPI0037AD9639